MRSQAATPPPSRPPFFLSNSTSIGEGAGAPMGNGDRSGAGAVWSSVSRGVTKVSRFVFVTSSIREPPCKKSSVVRIIHARFPHVYQSSPPNPPPPLPTGDTYRSEPPEVGGLTACPGGDQAAVQLPAEAEGSRGLQDRRPRRPPRQGPRRPGLPSHHTAGLCPEDTHLPFVAALNSMGHSKLPPHKTNNTPQSAIMAKKSDPRVFASFRCLFRQLPEHLPPPQHPVPGALRRRCGCTQRSSSTSGSSSPSRRASSAAAWRSEPPPYTPPRNMAHPSNEGSWSVAVICHINSLLVVSDANMLSLRNFFKRCASIG